MKKCMTFLAVAVALAGGRAHADYVNMAGTITGTNSFSAAAYSGLDSTGNFTTAVGNNSFRQSSQNDSVAVGSMALSNAKNGDMNVMVGVYAGFGSTNLNGCVGIGPGVFLGANSMTNATSVNGQFVAQGDRNRFWVTPDKMHNANWDGCPPIYYDNGTLYLNARAIVKRDGVVEKTAPLHAANWTGAMSDSIFVASYGDDTYAGDSTYYPKRTLQAALNALTNDTTTIYLDGGTYAAPAYLNLNLQSSTEHRVHIVGVGKPEDVIIDCGGTNRIAAGSSGLVAIYENVTFKDVATPTSGLSEGQRGAFQLFYMYNCRVVGAMSVSNSYWPFVAGYIEKSVIDVTLSAVGSGTNFDQDYGTVFDRVNAYDSTFKFAKGSGTMSANLCYGLRAENCYFDFEKLYYYYIRSVRGASGEIGGMLDCTFALSNGVYTASSTGANNNGACSNLIYAVGATAPTNAKASYTTSYTNLMSRLNATTHRPAETDFDIVSLGYDSAHERSVRDGAVLSVMAVLEATGTLSATQSSALATKRAALKARNQPYATTRNRNANINYTADRTE